ncbi:MAG: EAL domain-containing protein [Rhodanobacter sp.]
MAEELAEGILIVADAHDLRRQLFDVLDRAGWAPIYCARSALHAATLLHDQPPLEWILLAAGADLVPARRSCAQVRRIPAGVDAALLVIVEDGVTPSAESLPGGTQAWLHAAQIEAELLPRLREAGLASARSGQPATDATAALRLLARLSATATGIQSHEAAAQLLVDGLNLDYLALWSARAEDGGEPLQLLQISSGSESAWIPAPLQTCLQTVLGGKTLLYPLATERVALVDPLLQQLGLTGFIGLPLLDDRRDVIGALLVGSRRPLPGVDVMEPMLRCAAARFAHGLEMQRTREQGRSEGLMDTLTTLPNRLLFNDRLATILREATRNGESFAVLLVDIDHLTAINERHGHLAGDEVLRQMARRLCACIRASDTVARYAGDEFTVILRHIIKIDDVLRIAEKILQATAAEVDLVDGVLVRATVSAGISVFPDDAGDADSLLKHADVAMHAAKRLGRDNFQIYEASVDRARKHGMALRSRLRHAQANGELRVVYQPQVDTLTEDIVGMEALVRWEHPELGLVSPTTFIPLAEETGLVVSIGEWVLRTACKQAQAWQQRYGLRLRLGVNLSAVQLMEPALLETVMRALHDTCLEPGLLELEITESINVRTIPALVETLHALHELGCRIAIDDFGTGAASLDYLRRLPADRIKVDQSFVRNIGVDPDDEAIVRATIDMAHRLKRAVVAEGVETEQHLQFLRAEHCDELQGYLFARPLQPASFDALLAEREHLLQLAVS